MRGSHEKDAAVTVRDEDTKKAEVTVARESSLPLYQSATLAGVYMAGCMSFYLLIRYSKAREKATGELLYDNAAAVFWTEAIKLTFSVGAMHYRTGKFLPFTVFRDGSWRIGIFYAVPSGIYAIYNNMTYTNLTTFDPGTFQVFMQMRVLFTAIVYTWLLKRSLSQRKWVALVVLTLGVSAKYFTWDLQIDYRVVFMLFQASLSAFAGVYNEYLLKKDISMDVNEQNFFMYSFALIFNLGWGMFNNPTYYSSGKFLSNTNSLFLLIVCNGAVIGIVTSLILKFINVIVKAFASACEVLLTAVLAWMLLGEDLTKRDFVACVIVMYSIYLYYYMPPAAPATSPVAKEEEGKN